MSRNGPAEPIWTVNVITVWGGENLFLTEAEAKRYNADPDAFAARHFGLSKIEYYQWLDTEGSPLCGHRTASGDKCRNRTGGFQHVPNHWKSKHRKHLCAAHARKTEREK
jgi:hypothetical protein